MPVSPSEFRKDPDNVREMKLTELNDNNLLTPEME